MRTFLKPRILNSEFFFINQFQDKTEFLNKQKRLFGMNMLIKLLNEITHLHIFILQYK